MNHQELLTEIERLPFAEQRSLIETLARLVSRRVDSPNDVTNSLQRVRGMLKPGPDELMPSDAGLEDGYTGHLIRKYA